MMTQPPYYAHVEARQKLQLDSSGVASRYRRAGGKGAVKNCRCKGVEPALRHNFRTFREHVFVARPNTTCLD